VQELADYAVKLETAADKGVTSKGVTLDDDMRESFRIDADLIRKWAAQSKDSRWEAPDLTLTADTGVDLGGRVVTLRHLGKANTPGDIVAWDEKTRTLVTGDIVVHPTPYSFGSWHSDWIDVLAAMRALQPSRVVPGHGAVMANDDYLEMLQALLTETRTQVRAAVAAGKSLEDVRKDVTLPEFETRFAGDSVERRRAFRQFYLQPGIERAWKEAKGEPLTE
jgi:glyoxylase-like metal-dependent hydrolase (beta-lactamase superfamily II)